ncbi:MAG: serine/threonine protein kinase [Myxococcota bacterium]|jgi:serine/threonine protein kinase
MPGCVFAGRIGGSPTLREARVFKPSKFAFESSDSKELRRQKSAIFVIASACCFFGSVWTAMYWALFGWGLTAALPAAFVLIVGTSLVVSHRTRQHMYAVYAQILCIMYITAFIQWSIGGVFDSGFVLAWAFCGPICALVFFRLRRALLWFALYLVNVAITVAFDDIFQAHGHVVTESIREIFFVMNLSGSSLVVFIFAGYLWLNASSERERADALQQSLTDEKAKRIGPYTLEERLGQGGMGVVYRARHALLRRKTAIKLLKDGAGDEQRFKRFEREVQLTSDLNHPNVVAIYDYGRSPDGEFYYAMEHLPGTDLDGLVQAVGPVPLARALNILGQALDALDAAHEAGLIHRDIKPANIIISRFGKRTDVVKVLDFGLVKEVQAPSGLTHLTTENTICGTPDYIAPEALLDPENVGPGVDLYAIGAVAYFLVTGSPVFTGKTAMEIFSHHMTTPPRPPSEHSELPIPEAFDRWVLRLLAKHASDRYASAVEARSALDAIEVQASWTDEKAHRWWDTFESNRAARVETKRTESRRSMTIAPRDSTPLSPLESTE